MRPMAVQRPSMITGAQIRQARKLLGWKPSKLARRAKVHSVIVTRCGRCSTSAPNRHGGSKRARVTRRSTLPKKGASSPAPEPSPARDHAREQHTVEHEPGAQGGEDPRERARQAQDEEAAEDGDEQAQKTSENGPEEAAGSLGREVKAQTKSEEAVGRADDAEVGGAGREHARVVAEQPEPRLRPGCSGKANRFGHAECERASGERDAHTAEVREARRAPRPTGS